MKIKTFILTFLLMSCPFLFGQSHWDSPHQNGETNMVVTSSVYLDGELLTNTSYEVAAFCGDELRFASKIENYETISCVNSWFTGIAGETIHFRLFNGTNEYVSATTITYVANGEVGSFANLFRIDFKSVAKIEGTEFDVVYPSLQAAIDACTTGENTVTLLADNISENVTVVQAQNKKVTIEGQGKTYKGTITVDGKSAAYATAALTINNVKFDATNIAKDASINLGGNNSIRYTSNVTVNGCTFTGTDKTKVGIKNYTAGCKNLVVSGDCTAEGLHSLVQVKGVEGITVADVTIKNGKNGIAVGTSTNVNIKDSTIEVDGYGVRADGEGAYDMTLAGNTITADLPVVVRKTTGAYNLTVESGSYTASNGNPAVTFTTGDDGTFVAPTTNATAKLAEGITYFGFEAKVNNVYHTTFANAYAAAGNGDALTLLKDFNFDTVVKIEKAITLDLNNNTVTSTARKAFEVYANATIKNGTIIAKERAVDTRKNVELALNNVSLSTTGSGNTQPLTIGGSNNGTKVTLTGVNINAGNAGYGIITFVKTELTATNSEINGYSALYVKEGSAGSEFVFNNSTLTGSNATNDVAGNSFSTIAIQEDGVKVTVNNGTIKATGTNYAALSIGYSEQPINKDNIVTLDAEINGNILKTKCLDKNTVIVRDDYKTVLEGLGYATSAAGTGLVKVEGVAVAMIGTTPYASITAAIKAATAGQTITLLKDVEESFTISKSVTIDGAGKKYTGTMTGNKGLTVTIQNVNFVNAGCEINSEKTTGNYTFEKCTFDGKGTYAYPIKVASANTITVKECTVNDYLYSFLYIRTATLNVNVKDVTVEDCPSYAVYFASGVNKSTIENLTVKKSNNGIVYNNTANRTLNSIKNCTFENVTTAINHDKGTNTITCNLNGVNDFGGAALSQYVKIVAEAQIGNKFYDKLQDAIIAAEATEENETIKIAANFSTETTYKVNGNVTIDLNGKTIAGTDNETKSFALIEIQPGKELTINDSSNGNGKITLESTNNRAWNAYSSVISNQRGKLVVNGGTIQHLGGTDMAYAIDNLTNTGAQKAETVVNGGKVISEYRAIRQFANSTTGENILTINGGEVSYVWMQSANAYANLAATHVEGGTVGQIRISGNNAVLDLKVKASCLGENGVWGTMPTGKVLKEVEGYYTLVDAIAKIVAADNTTTYYASIQEAVNAATTDQVVTVCADVELANTLTIAAGKVVTLDLNGKVVSGVSATAGTTAVISNKGNLTVKSSVEGGKITTQALYPDTNWGGEGQLSFPSYANNTVRNEGTFTLVSGTIENTSAAGGATYAIDNYNGSKTNIEGGLVYCENNIAIRLFCGNNIALNVKGGEVKGTRALWIQLASSNASVAPNVDVNIEGGTLTATGNGEYKLAIYSYSYGNNMQNVEINISNGTFNGDIALTGGSNRENVEKLNITGGTFNGKDGDVYSYGDDAKAIEAITITGGTFNSNYAEKYAEDDNFIFVKNDEGKYNVTGGAYVAAIGETRYSSVANAIEAALAGETITLLKNVTEDVTINKDLTIDGANNNYTGNISVKGSTVEVIVKNVKFIDGTGYAITTNTIKSITVESCTVNNYGFGFLYANRSTPTVVVKNVTVDGGNYGMHWVYGTKATLENVTMTNVANGLYIQNHASKTINVKNSTITKIAIWEKAAGVQTFNFEGNNTVGTLSASQYAKYVLTAEGTTLTAPEGVTVTTTVEDHSVKYLEGAYKLVPNVARIGDVTYASIQEAINAAQNGDEIVLLKNIELSDEDIVPTPTVAPMKTMVYVKGKDITLNMNGYSISVKYVGDPYLISVICVEDAAGLKVIGNGSIEVEGVAYGDQFNVAYVFCKRGSTGHLTIENGTYHAADLEDSMVYTNGNAIVNINGGTFKLDNVGTQANGFPCIFNVAGGNAGHVVVNGGTFNADVNHQFWENEVFVPETLALQNIGNGTWKVVPAEAYVEEIATSTGSSTRNVGYATLEEAFAVAMEKDRKDVVLVKDVELENTLTVNAGEQIVLDLNGKTISQEKECTASYSMFTNKGKLTIEGEGTINFKDLSNGGGSEWGTYVITNNGELIVKNGTIEHLGTADNNFDTNIPIQNYAGKVTIDGGTIKSTQFRSLRDFTAGGEIVINGGKFIGQVWMQGLGNGSSSLTINGGEFEPQANDGSSVFITNGTNVVNVSITGGKFATKIGATVPTKEGVAGCIKGGTFTTTAKENTNAALVNENYSFVENVDGTWTVLPIQTQQIVAGWNWYSSYLNIEGETGLAKLQTALTNGGIIKAQNGDQRKYEAGAWRGFLTNYDMTQMYMINVSEDQELSINAPLADAADYTIELVPNWNWIGYPSNNANVDINVALNNLTPAAGDRIKTQNNGFAEFAFGKWMGALRQLVPGQGYMYNNKSGETKTFVYNAETVRGSVEANVTAENNYWTPNSRLYPYNMTVTAVLDEMGDNYEIAAFVNGEVRGSARPIYIEEVDTYMFFLTIHGENVEEMTFKCYDLTTGEEFDLINRMNYSNDAIVGSVNEPYLLSRGTLGLEEVSSFNIYPNPTTTDREINLSTTCDKVEVFNALGVKVAEYQNVDTLDAFETAGIYVIRVTNNGNVKHCRLVVK